MLYPDPTKVILTDCDGVLVNWDYAFKGYMMSHGYKVETETEYCMGQTFGIDPDHAFEMIQRFNESAAIANLPPMRDAIKYVRKLHEEHGYIFHVITTVGNSEDTIRARKTNLENLFGKTAIAKIDCLDHEESKTTCLEHYKDSGCFWLEDKPSNAVIGADLGLKSILIHHTYNSYFNNPSVGRIVTWKNLYNDYFV